MSSVCAFGPALLSDTPVVLFTAGAAGLTIQRIFVSNPAGSGGSATFTFSIDADSASTRIYASEVLAEGEQKRLYGPFALDEGESLFGYADVASRLVVNINGVGEVEPDGSTLFDDFLGSSLNQTLWTGGVVGAPEFDRKGDDANGEQNRLKPAQLTLAGSILSLTATYLPGGATGDRDVNPPHDFVDSTTRDYTSGQIQSRQTFLYGTISARLKPPPGGQGVWPCFWMLGENWQASQPYTANVAGHDWPNGAWCETDIAEFMDGVRDRVNNVVHYNSSHIGNQNLLPFDADTRYMVYRLQWSDGVMIWSVDAEDGEGFQTLQTVSNPSEVPNVPMYIVLNMAVGGFGGTPVPAGFPATMEVDWVRVTQP